VAFNFVQIPLRASKCLDYLVANDDSFSRAQAPTMVGTSPARTDRTGAPLIPSRQSKAPRSVDCYLSEALSIQCVEAPVIVYRLLFCAHTLQS
jgi:hypothetical protein